MKDKLLDKLTDEIEFIDNLSFQSGESKTLREFAKYDKQLAKHKTKALQIIEKLR